MNRVNLKKNSWIAPLPVLLIGTFDNDLKPNLMNAAWGGIFDTNQIHICLSSNHKTSSNIKLLRCFTVSFAEKDLVNEADYVGVISGNSNDKINELGFHYSKSENINAPIFDEFKLTLECEVFRLEDDGETMHVYADIVNISAREDIISEGKIDVSKFSPIVYNPLNNSYESNGIKVGDAFRCYKSIKIKK